MGKVRCYLSNVACFETFSWPPNRTVHESWGTVHAHNKKNLGASQMADKAAQSDICLCTSNYIYCLSAGLSEKVRPHLFSNPEAVAS